jgi:hypothetical protein
VRLLLHFFLLSFGNWKLETAAELTQLLTTSEASYRQTISIEMAVIMLAFYAHMCIIQASNYGKSIG